MQVALFGRTISEGRSAYIKLLFSLFHEKGFHLHIYEPFYKLTKHLLPIHSRIQTFEEIKEIVPETEILVTIGGDGTLLEAITLVKNSGLPLLGINTGRLGFLTGYSLEELSEMVEDIKNRKYSIENRALLKVESDSQSFDGINFALNDITLHKKDTSSMISLQVTIDEQLVNNYWADGLIFSTPTGSTGYSLSCGGPLLMPDSTNLVITPIAPHNLNVRPLVLNDSHIIDVQVESRSKNFLTTLDSRSYSMMASDRIRIKRADFNIKLAKKENQSFLKTIREKLQWGFDKRN
jgi:NAD+ kinase